MRADNIPLPAVSAASIEVSALVFTWQISAILSMLVFTSFSFIDLKVSALFFGGEKFDAVDIHALEVVRQVIWKGTILLALLCLIGTIFGLFDRRLLWVSPRRWAFSTALFLIGPVLIVNEGLKTFWGRARPADILDFGGSKVFTPALVPSDACARNCSFASGEGSGAVAFAIVVWVLIDDIPHGVLRSALRTLVVIIAVVGSLLRIATGRHFLSDTVFAALIVTGIALLLRPMLPHRGRETATRLWRR